MKQVIKADEARQLGNESMKAKGLKRAESILEIIYDLIRRSSSEGYTSMGVDLYENPYCLNGELYYYICREIIIRELGSNGYKINSHKNTIEISWIE